MYAVTVDIIILENSIIYILFNLQTKEKINFSFSRLINIIITIHLTLY